MGVAKPFNIPKKLVWEAYLRVKANGGAPGVDGQTIEAFERDLKDNLYRLWNRMSSGTYFPPPVLRVAIPKRSGGVRNLGIPTVADRIAQTVVKMALEPGVEPRFHPDSYGYRPGRSAVHAAGQARERCWKFDWVLDLDIRAFFDSLDHEFVMRAVRRYTSERWVLLYIERWLKAPVQVEGGALEPREAGTPQGGVISPLLANIFLHLAFDTWMAERFPGMPFERYADDVIVHCRTEQQAQALLHEVRERLRRCRLDVHPQKTKIVYCKDANRKGSADVEKFDFLGFTFRPRPAMNRRGAMFASFSPAISGVAATGIRRTMRRNWRIRRRTDKDLNELANMFNPELQGWIQYYGSYYRSALCDVFRPMNRALMKWATRKYKRFRGHRRRAGRWLEAIARRQPTLFAHWPLFRARDGWMIGAG
jgi:group II intron reverse transcriptase/maturase